MLSAMKYKDFTWPNNPRVFEAYGARRIAVHRLPFAGAVLQDMGNDCRVFSGEGEFVGDDAYLSFKKLSEVFSREGAGMLTHPVWQPVNAYFTKLRLREEPRKDYVSYSFEFLECPEKSRRSNAVMYPGEPEYCTVRQGDTVADIAAICSVPENELLRLNPQVRNPNMLTAGMRLRVK